MKFYAFFLVTICSIATTSLANFDDIWISPKNPDEAIYNEKVSGGLQGVYPGLKVRIASGFI